MEVKFHIQWSNKVCIWILHKKKIASVNEPKIAKDFYETNYNYKAKYLASYVIRSEKGRLPRTQQQDTLFTIKQIIARYWCWKLPGLLLLWLVCEACQTSTSVRVAFKWLHIPLTSRQLAVIHHTNGWWVWPWI